MSDEELDLAPDSDGWNDVEDDAEEVSLQCLFCDIGKPSLSSFLDHGKSEHNFDLLELRQKHALDFYNSIKLVNYIRSEVKANKQPDLSSTLKWVDEVYLQPVLDDDAVLFSLDDLDSLAIDGDKQNGIASSTTEETVGELKQQLADMKSQFDVYRAQVSETLEKRWQDNEERAPPKPSAEDVYDNQYFSGYATNGIHQTMLQDTVRTDAYRDFIYDNKHLFKDKVVLDVGCGTGILSMFCAKAGARKVIAVDNSSIIDKARQIAADNHLLDHITFVKRKVEEIDVLPDGLRHVDIIVSEWMGYGLFFEAMLPSVLLARDRFLKRGADGVTFDGLIAPSHCSIQVAPIHDPNWVADNITYWQDVYGFNMQCMMQKALDEVVIRSPPADTVFASAKDDKHVRVWDLYVTKVEDLTFECDFEVAVGKNADSLDAWCIWFDIDFSPEKPGSAAGIPADDARRTAKGAVTFTTGPHGKETHWQTAVCTIERTSAPVALKQGEVINGRLRYAKGEDARAVEIKLDWNSTVGENGEQLWKLR